MYRLNDFIYIVNDFQCILEAVCSLFPMTMIKQNEYQMQVGKEFVEAQQIHVLYNKQFKSIC